VTKELRELAAVDRHDVADVRLARPKRLLRRLLRLLSAPQAVFNHRVLDELERTSAELDECRRQLDETRAELARLRHAALGVHGPLIVDLVDRVGGLVDTP
jgi:hypothetical protein